MVIQILITCQREATVVGRLTGLESRALVVRSDRESDWDTSTVTLKVIRDWLIHSLEIDESRSAAETWSCPAVNLMEGVNVRVRSRVIGMVIAMLVSTLALPTSAQAVNANGGQVKVDATVARDVQVTAPPRFTGVHAASLPITAMSSGSIGVANVITCTPNVQHPHKSSHVPGTVNVVVTVNCSQPVSAIGIRGALYRNGYLVADSGQSNFYGTGFAVTNAAASCITAWYTGWIAFSVNFPPGYSPPTGGSSGFGSQVFIAC